MAHALVDRPLSFPDVEELLATFLATRPELDGTSIGTTLPDGFDGSQKVVFISRLGGAYISDNAVDDTIVKIDVYAPGKPLTHALTNTVRGALPLLCLASHAGGTVVSDVDEIQGPCWSPDRRFNSADRYVMRYRIVVGVSPGQR